MEIPESYKGSGSVRLIRSDDNYSIQKSRLLGGLPALPDSCEEVRLYSGVNLDFMIILAGIAGDLNHGEIDLDGLDDVLPDYLMSPAEGS